MMRAQKLLGAGLAAAFLPAVAFADTIAGGEVRETVNYQAVGMFRDFRLSGTGAEANTIDLKLNGVTPFVDAARIMALANKVAATNTVARLEGAARAGALDAGDVAAWTDSYDYIRMLRLRLNERQAQADRDLGNRVDPAQLNDLDRRILRESFKEARRLQAKLAIDYQL